MTGNHFRTGIGFDFHRLVEGRDLILGGVEIPYAKGLLGHSDADVLVHAICDALLGACGLGDIGIHFPDTDPAYKGVSSLELLGKTCALIDANGYRIVNVDAVVLAGGSTRSPLVRRRAAEFFGRAPHCQLDPDHVVALGAAIVQQFYPSSQELQVIGMDKELEYVLAQALQAAGGNVTVAARACDMERQAFQRLLRRYNIESRRFR